VLKKRKGIQSAGSPILIREERKTGFIPYEWGSFEDILMQAGASTGDELKLFPAIERNKRAFYLRSWNENVFQVSVDRSEVNRVIFDQKLDAQSMGNSLVQVEIEYVGTLLERDAASDDEIYRQIQQLVKTIEAAFGVYLRPGTLTKFDWLLSQLQASSF
jgi:hypothetical protein